MLRSPDVRPQRPASNADPFPARARKGNLLASLGLHADHVVKSGANTDRTASLLAADAGKSNEKLFSGQEAGIRLQKAQLACVHSLPIHLKTTTCSRCQALVPQNQAGYRNPRRFAPDNSRQEVTAAAMAACAALRQPQKETLAEFIAKKREIFLVQMSLDTKKAEMRKLEELGRGRGVALDRSEAMLEEDSARFDVFLRENDERVQEALQSAEAEAKVKQEKVAEIKRLTVAVGAARAEVAKLEEAVEECCQYRTFLEAITPPDWTADEAAARAAAHAAKCTEWEAECAALRERRAAAQRAVQGAEAAAAAAVTQQQAEAAEEVLRRTRAVQRAAEDESEPPRPQEPAPDEADAPMYFKDPQQLRAIFVAAEEANIFLIQNAQAAEEAAEATAMALAAAKQTCGEETAALRRRMAALQRSVAAAAAKCTALRARAGSVRSGSRTQTGPRAGAGDGPPVGWKALQAKVAATWSRCGGEGDAGASPLAMLASLETQLEDLLVAVAQLPPGMAAATEHAREKERRQAVREARMRALRLEHERRAQRAFERANAPVFRRKGKPPMPRSRLPQRVRAAAKGSSGAERAREELAAFLAREDLL